MKHEQLKIVQKLVVIALLFPITMQAQNQDHRTTVAVIPAEGASVSVDIRIGVTNGLQEGVFNSGEYTLLARGKAFEKAMTEMKFQESGAVSDAQLTEFGHATGADYVCYATLSKYSESSFRISYKMIHVASGEIVNMGSETIRDGVDGLLTATDNIAKKLFGSGASTGMSGGCEYSGSNSIDHVAWHDGNSGQRTHAVGTKQPNELGIYDMSGNVWEWCEDRYDSDHSSRVLRGGSWYYYARYCRVSNRYSHHPDARYGNFGFRVVLSQ